MRTLALLLLLSSTALAQFVISPARDDNLVARGGGAIVIGDGAVFATEHSVAEHFYPPPTILNGVSGTIDGLPISIWVIYPTSIHIVIPIDLYIAPREGLKTLHLTTPLGEWLIPIKVAKSAPGLMTDGRGGLGGYVVSGDGFHLLLPGYPITIDREGAGTWLVLIASGIRGDLRPLRRWDFPMAPWFEPDAAIWLGDWRIDAAWYETGLPGLDYIGGFLPLNLPTGQYEVRVEAGRRVSPARDLWLQFQ